MNDSELIGQWVASTEKQKREKMFRFYYNLTCCCAWESLTVFEQRVGSKEKWNLLSTKFRDVQSGYPLVEANQEGSFFSNLTWPEGFLKYCDQQHQSPTKPSLMPIHPSGTMESRNRRHGSLVPESRRV